MRTACYWAVLSIGVVFAPLALKSTGNGDFFARERLKSPAGNFFSPRREKKRFRVWEEGTRRQEISQHQLRSYPDSAAAEYTSHAKLSSPEAEDSEMLEASKVCFFFHSHNFVSVDVYAIVLYCCGFLFMVVLQYLEFFNVAGAVSRDELFGRFYAGLDKINFFTCSPGGPEDPNRIAKATQMFDEAWIEMGSSQSQVMNLSNLAEIFKSKGTQINTNFFNSLHSSGNDCIRMKLYSEAIELYTCAIAICEKAIYYSNR
ncbi:hypothetical protein BHE74_00006215 [Ensete ventricosum]|nr:hypothetical protein BHE74_00006215 [Ensete ventricosum]